MMRILFTFCFLLGTALALPYSTQQLNELDSNDNLIKVAEKLNLKTFVSNVLSTDVSKVINHDGPFTVFAPNDTAFEVQMEYPTGFVLNEAMLFHVGYGKVMESDITNEKVIKSLLGGRFIRFNVYNNGQVKTANGRRIMKTDNIASNGVVHVVGGVMSSIYKPSESIASEMVNHYPTHSTFMELVKMSKLFPVLSNMNTPMTLFAPTNEAMSAVDPDFMNELKHDMNKLRAAIMGHMVKGTWFTPGMISGETVKTEMGVEYMIETDSQGVMTVGGSKISLPDIVAANGAVHSMDKFMMTKEEINSMISSETLMKRMTTLLREGKEWTMNRQSWAVSGGNGQVWTSGNNQMNGGYTSLTSKSGKPMFQGSMQGNMNGNFVPQDVYSQTYSSPSSPRNGQWSQKYGRTFAASPSSSDIEQSSSSWMEGPSNGLEKIGKGMDELSSGARDVVSSLKNLGHHEFALAVKESGMTNFFEQNPGSFYTLFAPSDEGWTQTVQNSQESLATLVMAHMVSGIRTPELEESMLTSLVGSNIHIDNLNSGRLQTYSPRQSLTANGVLMDGRVATIRSGHVRIYSLAGGLNAISMGEGTIMKQLSQQEEYSKFVSYAVEFGWDAIFGSKDSVLTILAPTNEAITNAESNFSKKDIASIMMSNHIIPGSFFKSKMESNGVIVPLSGHKIAVHSSGSTLELSGGAHITKMDMAAANGVVHQVDSLIIVQSE